MAVYAAESLRLWLQPLNVEDHLADYHQIMSQPESMLWSTSACHTSLDETRRHILDSLPTTQRPWNRRWAILLRPAHAETNPKPKMIGLVGTPREAEVAYKVHLEYWGKGYMSEALELFIQLFWQLEGNERREKLLAFADPENGASVRVLEKAGFQKGPLLKEYYERAALGGRKSDLLSFHLERLGV